MYAGPGIAWRRLGTVKTDKPVILRGIVRNPKGNLWRAVRYGNTEGYIPSSAAKLNEFKAYNGVIHGTDGTLSVRVSPGGSKATDLYENDEVRVINAAVDASGSEWLCIKTSKARGYVAGKYVKNKK